LPSPALGNASSLADLADLASAESRIDTLFVNAGSTVPTPMQAISADTFDAMIDVHVKGPFFLI
jgi:NADP-dependent 3-hydroxy acid dehydrogenase YdfG